MHALSRVSVSTLDAHFGGIVSVFFSLLRCRVTSRLPGDSLIRLGIVLYLCRGFLKKQA